MKFWEGRTFAVFHKLEAQGWECESAPHYAQWPPAASGMEANHHDWWKSSWVTDEIQFPFPPFRLVEIQLGNRWNSVPVSALEGRSGEADIPNIFSSTFPKGSTCRENICIPTPPPWLLLAQGIHFSGRWVWRKKGLFPVGLLFGIHAVCVLSELSCQCLLWESGWSLPRSGPSGANRRLTGLVS